jgi:hypothetical protein
LYLYDQPFDDNYDRETFIISQSYYSGSTNTIVELYNTSVNTSIAYVGDLGQGIANWAGNQTIPGNYSHTEGSNTFAIGDYSHAEGASAQAIGNYSHAEGEAVQSIGGASHAEGYYTIALGDYSHAEGDGSQAIGDYSHAEGNNTIASGSYQHVSGQFNQHNNDTSLFVVGIGTSDGARKDGFTVDVDGDGFGSIMIPTVNSGNPLNPKTGSMHFDDGNNVLWIYNGSNWGYVALTFP